MGDVVKRTVGVELKRMIGDVLKKTLGDVLDLELWMGSWGPILFLSSTRIP